MKASNCYYEIYKSVRRIFMFKRIKTRLAKSLIRQSNVFVDLREIQNSLKDLQFLNQYEYELGKNKVVPKIVSHKETIQMIIKNRASLARFGDGEFSLMFDKPIKFQEEDIELSELLKKTLLEEHETILIGLADTFSSLGHYSDYGRLFWRKYWIAHRKKVYDFINFYRVYHDTNITRPNNEFITKDDNQIIESFKLLQSVWEDRECVLITGDLEKKYEYDILSNAKKIEIIPAPAQNAFSKLNDIIEETREKDLNLLILISLGPTATVLVYKLALLGYQCIDIGHARKDYDFFLHGNRSGGLW